jgi:predicted DNA-binding protein
MTHHNHPEKRQFTAYLTRELHERLQIASKRTDIAMANIVAEAVEVYLASGQLKQRTF